VEVALCALSLGVTAARWKWRDRIALPVFWGAVALFALSLLAIVLKMTVPGWLHHAGRVLLIIGGVVLVATVGLAWRFQPKEQPVDNDQQPDQPDHLSADSALEFTPDSEHNRVEDFNLKGGSFRKAAIIMSGRHNELLGGRLEGPLAPKESPPPKAPSDDDTEGAGKP